MKKLLLTTALVLGASTAFASNPPASPLLTDLVENRAAIEAEIAALEAWANDNSGPTQCLPWADLAGACGNVSEIHGASIDFATFTIAVADGVNVLVPPTADVPDTAASDLSNTFAAYEEARDAKATAADAIDASYEYDVWFTAGITISLIHLQGGGYADFAQDLAPGLEYIPAGSSNPRPFRGINDETLAKYDRGLSLLRSIEEAIAEGDTDRLLDLRIDFKSEIYGLGTWDALPSGRGFDAELRQWEEGEDNMNRHRDNVDLMHRLYVVYEHASDELVSATHAYIQAANAAGVEPQL